jgi:hypothetical protein
MKISKKRQLPTVFCKKEYPLGAKRLLPQGTRMTLPAIQCPPQKGGKLGLELAIEVWRLRCSVFRGTPMAFFCVYFKELNCYKHSISKG